MNFFFPKRCPCILDKSSSAEFSVESLTYNYLKGYSKSCILDLAEAMAEAAVPYFPENTANPSLEPIANEHMFEDPCNLPITTVNSITEQMHKNQTIDKVVFNDGTPAGVLNNLKGCTRTMHLHEADVTLKSSGLMLPSPIDLNPTRIDPFRSTLMALHEKPGNFLRVLKKESVHITGSKLNIFGASTGDLIAAELARQAASMAADALFERFILWPIDGEPIPNNCCISSIDFTQYPSLEQFGVLCGFFSNLHMDLEQEGKAILAEQAFNFRVAGNQEGVQDNVSARLNKTALVGYRVAGLSALLEATFDICDKYVNEYISFGTGEVDYNFFSRAKRIAESVYGCIIRKEERLVISTDICKRAHDVTFQNLAQYMALMKIQNEDKSNWLMQNSRTMKTTMRLRLSDDGTQSTEPISTNHVEDGDPSNINFALTRKQKNMLRKINSYKASILLHPSLVFIKSGLYANSALKKASSILEQCLLKPLVNEGYIVDIPEGLVCRKSKTTVYVKMVPHSDVTSRAVFTDRLLTFQDQRLTLETYLDSCRRIIFHSAGVVSSRVIEFLQQENYRLLKIDPLSLIQRTSTEQDQESFNHICSMSTEDFQSVGIHSDIQTNEDNRSIRQSESEEDNSRHGSNILDLVEDLVENILDSPSNLISPESASINEEMVDHHHKMINNQVSMLQGEIEITRKSVKQMSNSENILFCDNTFSETIAERLRIQPRKRVKTRID